VTKRHHTNPRPFPSGRTQPGPLSLVPASSPEPDLHTHQLHLLIGAITAGHLDDQLPTLQAAISHRYQQQHRAESNQAAAHINIGDRVQLTHDVRPLYLHGATGTVTGWAGQSVIVQLDQPIGRFTTGQVRCPPLGLLQLHG
jgi:hypothetical protein